MKMLKKYVYMLTLAAAAFGFAGCTEDGEYSPAVAEDGARVFFSKDASSTYVVEKTSTSVTVPVLRSETEGALEASINASFGSSDYASFFTVQQTVVFNDGANSTDVKISFDRSKLADGASYSITLNVVDEMLHTNFGASSQTITISVPEPYVLLGTGLWRDDLITGIFTAVKPSEYEVEVYENTNYPGNLYLKNVYTSLFPYNEPGDYVTGDYYLRINVEDPNEVFLPTQELGLNWGYGMISVGTVVAGTLKNGILTFPAQAFYLAMADYNGGNWSFYGNPNGLLRLVMPGASVTDYSMTVTYGGMQVEADNTTVSAVLNGTYGADVASMRYAYFDGDVTGAAAQAAEIIIAAAEEEVGVKKFEQGLGEEDRVFSILESELVAPAVYTVFCVPYNAAGEPQAAATAAVSFYFPGMGGQELPECELVCGVFPFSWLYPAEYHSAYPDSSTLAAIIAGVDIASCRYGFITGLHLADLGFEGDVAGETAVAVQDFVTEALGVSSTDDWMQALGAEEIAYINSENGLDVFFDGLPAEMSCTLFVEGKNSYGKSQVYASSGATTAEGVQAEPMAQKGSVKAGQYVMKARRTPGQALKAHTLKK